jgi:hypothetical protein
MRTRTKPRYVMPTGTSLLTNKCLEMMHAHSRGDDYKYDDFPIYRISEALVDQNTLLVVIATDEGHYGESDKLS